VSLSVNASTAQAANISASNCALFTASSPVVPVGTCGLLVNVFTQPILSAQVL